VILEGPGFGAVVVVIGMVVVVEVMVEVVVEVMVEIGREVLVLPVTESVATILLISFESVAATMATDLIMIKLANENKKLLIL